jgi:hypothetical protein
VEEERTSRLLQGTILLFVQSKWLKSYIAGGIKTCHLQGDRFEDLLNMKQFDRYKVNAEGTKHMLMICYQNAG